MTFGIFKKISGAVRCGVLRCSKALTLTKSLQDLFSSVAHRPIETKLFVFIKISYLQPFREIMGGQTKRKFSAKNDAAGRKNDFFEFSFSVAHLPIETKLFCFY